MTLYESNFESGQPIMRIRARVATTYNLYKNSCGGFATLKRKRSDEDIGWNNEYTYSRLAEPSTSTADLVEAHICSWHWCERAITNLSVINGELHDSGTNETPLTRTTQNIQTVWPAQLFFDDDDFWDEDSFWEGDYELVANYSLPPRVYKINRRSEAAVFAYLTALLHKDLAFSSNEGQPDAIIQALYQQDIHKIAHKIALSLSNAIRNPANVNATTLHGTALRQEVFVHVRWIWLAVPIILTVAGAALLVICIILSDASPTPILKSSALATLFHGAVGFSGNDLIPPMFEDSSALTVQTKVMKARLRRGPDGVLKFEKVD
jgi:hypothetical protein